MSPRKITIVHCWSAPRSRSTALLYSFEARGSSQCVAIDEPLYRPWLQHKLANANTRPDSVSRPYRPYSTELIQGIPHQDSKPEDSFKWAREKQSLNSRILDGIQILMKDIDTNNDTETDTELDGGVIFVKHMAKHSFLYNFDLECCQDETNNNDDTNKEYIIQHKHVLLIRDPVAILSSWNLAKDVHNTISPDEVGIIQLLSIYSTFTSLNKQIVVLDSDSLAKDPTSTLKGLCEDLNISYKDSMLTWESGKHDCDGPWADWWYGDVHESKGWIVQCRPSNNNNESNDSHSLSTRK